MNYRHIYHAGSIADVFKHSILVLLLDYLTKKDKPCVFIDTHAGIGLYDLQDERAKKTKESEEGIIKLVYESKCIPELTPYIKVVNNYRTVKEFFYPGSPFIMQSFQRSEDQLILNELHPEDFQTLKQHFKNAPNTHFHQRNAYELLPAILPPTPRRGLILIDPPFEKTDEFKQFEQALQKSLQRFSTGVYMMWYPIVDRSYQKQIQQIIDKLDYPVLRAEICLDEIYRVNRGLAGCGVMIINPPWKIEEPIQKIADYMCKLFAYGDGASASVQIK